VTEYNNTWDAARAYVKAGIYVNPVYVARRPDGKKDVRPVGLWRQTSSNSLADVAAWEQQYPDAGLLIDTGKSGLVVVDCDGEEGIANWLALNPPLPMQIAKTAGGGAHWYYQAHPDHVIGNDQNGKVAPSVDIRGLGGFVIAPPTTDGRGSWEWADAWDWTPVVVPDVVIERMKRREGAPIAAPVSQDTVTPTPTGDDLFDSPAREFTREQAKDYVKKARKVLAATTSGYNGGINNFAMACAHFPWLVDRALCATLAVKSLAPQTGWTAPDRDDIATVNSAYTATEQGRSWVATQVEANVAPEQADAGEVTGGVLPPPAQPLRVARELVGRMPQTDGEAHWSWWRNDFYQWRGAHWEPAEQPVIEHWLYRQTGDAEYLVPKKVKEGEKPEFEATPWAPTRKKITDLTHALGVGTLQRFGDEDKVLATANGVIVNGALQPHRPSRFNLFSMPFDYDPNATAPGWDAFLEAVLPGDRQAKEFLAEWFGYVLSGRTDQQKMAALIGEKRSGKGTIARVLSGLVGAGNVTGLNLNLLPGTFGMEPLVGRALGIAGDVRWASRNIADAIPILLGIIGEDAVSVPRKNRGAWHGTLGIRFMLMSNDTPTFSDKSGALGGRMVFVRFDQSFYGREDTSLTDKLLHELPGIFNWALDGLDRLNGRGRFTEPDSGAGERDAQRRLADPVGAFLDDWCVMGPECSITLDHLYEKYKHWCESEGRTRDSTTKEVFSRDLRTRVPGLVVDRERVNGKRVRMLRGVGSDAM
jgi:putative DNA primase/helicase